MSAVYAPRDSGPWRESAGDARMDEDAMIGDEMDTQQTLLQSVIDEVSREVTRATAKFPTWPTDPIHAGNVVSEEAGELAKAVLEHTYEPHKSTRDDVRKEAIETAAMAIRFVLSMNAYRFARCDRHQQSTQ